MNVLGANCTSGCRTKDHASYAECLRDKGTGAWMVAESKGFSQNAQRSWDKELEGYRAARAEGLQPDGTKWRHIDAARRKSDKQQAAYGRDFQVAPPREE